jgi:hypothetical protein
MGVAAVVGLIGAAIAAGQKKQEGIERKAYANYQAEQNAADAEFVAGQAKADATAAQEQSQLNASALRKQGRQQAAQANVALAASGVGLGSPGALKVNEDIAVNTEEAALNSILAGDRTAAASVATGQRLANKLNAEGNALRIGGKQAEKAANVQAASTLFSGASSAYSGWYTSQPSSTTAVRVNQ